MNVFDRKRAAVGKTDAVPRKQSHNPLYLFLVLAFAAGIAFLAFYQLPNSPLGQNQAATTATGGIAAAPAPLKPEEEAAALNEARGLLSRGDVAAARSRLKGSSPERSANLALLLAQSYDLNYLRTLPKADSPANKAEAERWYRTWYDMAARSGLEMDSERFQRIIKSLK